MAWDVSPVSGSCGNEVCFGWLNLIEKQGARDGAKGRRLMVGKGGRRWSSGLVRRCLVVNVVKVQSTTGMGTWQLIR